MNIKRQNEYYVIKVFILDIFTLKKKNQKEQHEIIH